VVNVFALDIADGVVQAIRCVVNPDKLRHLGPVSELAREAPPTAAAEGGAVAGTRDRSGLSDFNVPNGPWRTGPLPAQPLTQARNPSRQLAYRGSQPSSFLAFSFE
jgi:hypothetical protein